MERDISLFSWDNKIPGLHLLMSELTGRPNYKNTLKLFCRDKMPGGEAKRTPLGMVYLGDWGALRWEKCKYFSDFWYIYNESNPNASGLSVTTGHCEDQRPYSWVREIRFLKAILIKNSYQAYSRSFYVEYSEKRLKYGQLKLKSSHRDHPPA